MTSGRIKPLLILAVLPWIALAGPPDSFEAILEGIDTPRGVAIPFVEKRQNSLLDEPLVLTGEVIFDHDGRLSKIIEIPFRERVTISHDAVELEREGRTKRLSLRRKEDVGAFYVALRALLEGDAKTLLDLFEVETTIDGGCWTIMLVPNAGPLSEFLESMTISGSAAQVSRIRTVHFDGNWQELSFNADPAE